MKEIQRRLRTESLSKSVLIELLLSEAYIFMQYRGFDKKYNKKFMIWACLASFHIFLCPLHERGTNMSLTTEHKIRKTDISQWDEKWEAQGSYQMNRKRNFENI